MPPRREGNTREYRGMKGYQKNQILKKQRIRVKGSL